jgi:hypothetical protein
MNVRFEWHASNEDNEWETIAQVQGRPVRRWLRRVPRWVWGTLTALFLILGIGGYVLVRSRYTRALEQMTFQIQSVIDLEARAFKERDRDLFLAQQDEASSVWYARQEQRIEEDCAPPLAEKGTNIGQDRCAPALPAEIQRIDLRGDVAWVEVVEGQAPVRRTRFYRQTEQGWKHTAPSVAFWRDAIELHYGDVLFRFHQRDKPHVDPLVEHVAQTFYGVCAELDCPPDNLKLEVNFVAETSNEEELPRLEENELILASPWLSGLPIEGDWGEPYLRELTYWTAYVAAQQAMRSPTDQDLSSLQRTILIEYAMWYSEQDAARSPILGQIIRGHGVETLPQVFRWLKDTQDTHTWGSFMYRWLAPTSRETA